MLFVSTFAAISGQVAVVLSAVIVGGVLGMCALSSPLPERHTLLQTLRRARMLLSRPRRGAGARGWGATGLALSQHGVVDLGRSQRDPTVSGE